MTNPLGRRARIEGAIAHLPDTMTCSITALTELANIGVKSEGYESSSESRRLLATLISCIVMLEGRVNVLEGGPGLPDEVIDIIASIGGS